MMFNHFFSSLKRQYYGITAVSAVIAVLVAVAISIFIKSTVAESRTQDVLDQSYYMLLTDAIAVSAGLGSNEFEDRAKMAMKNGVIKGVELNVSDSAQSIFVGEKNVKLNKNFNTYLRVIYDSNSSNDLFLPMNNIDDVNATGDSNSSINPVAVLIFTYDKKSMMDNAGYLGVIGGVVLFLTYLLSNVFVGRFLFKPLQQQIQHISDSLQSVRDNPHATVDLSTIQHDEFENIQSAIINLSSSLSVSYEENAAYIRSLDEARQMSEAIQSDNHYAFYETAAELQKIMDELALVSDNMNDAIISDDQMKSIESVGLLTSRLGALSQLIAQIRTTTNLGRRTLSYKTLRFDELEGAFDEATNCLVIVAPVSRPLTDSFYVDIHSMGVLVNQCVKLYTDLESAEIQLSVTQVDEGPVAYWMFSLSPADTKGINKEVWARIDGVLNGSLDMGVEDTFDKRDVLRFKLHKNALAAEVQSQWSDTYQAPLISLIVPVVTLKEGMGPDDALKTKDTTSVAIMSNDANMLPISPVIAVQTGVSITTYPFAVDVHDIVADYIVVDCSDNAAKVKSFVEDMREHIEQLGIAPIKWVSHYYSVERHNEDFRVAVDAIEWDGYIPKVLQIDQLISVLARIERGEKVPQPIISFDTHEPAPSVASSNIITFTPS
ncbi:hypothetical protein OAV62_02100 [bacterium]|nr:hypothetical protein [bacterium]